MFGTNDNQKHFKRSVAVVGAGQWGKNHVRNFYELGALHTICDARPAILETFSKYSEVHATTDWDSVLKNPAIESVVLASPAMMHYKMAKEALQAGKDVFVEKPLCL